MHVKCAVGFFCRYLAETIMYNKAPRCFAPCRFDADDIGVASSGVLGHVTPSAFNNRMTVTQFRSISMPAGFRRHLVGKTLRYASTLLSLKYAL